jgi:hypothetical protein
VPLAAVHRVPLPLVSEVQPAGAGDGCRAAVGLPVLVIDEAKAAIPLDAHGPGIILAGHRIHGERLGSLCDGYLTPAVCLPSARHSSRAGPANDCQGARERVPC